MAMVACLVFTMTGCGKKKVEPPQPTTEETSESQTVVEGKNFTVSLESNQTTGYNWELAQPLDTNFVKLISTDYVAPTDSALGAPGKEVWQFQALKVGNTAIVLEYDRPWENEATPAKKHTRNVTINKPTSEVNETFNIEAGQTFSLSLEANPSTGYSWVLSQPPDEKILKLLSQNFVPSGNQVGAPGKDVWKFQGLIAGNTGFILQYQPSQGTNVTPEKKENIKVTITAAPSPPSPPKQYSDPKVPIKATVGEVFIIVLQSNASTGYLWELLQPVDGKILTLLGNEYREAAGSEVGGQGATYFTFQVAGKGNTVIHLGLMPPAAETPSQTADFTVEA